MKKLKKIVFALVAVVTILVSSIVLFSCDGGGVYQKGRGFGVGIYLYDKDNIDSDIIKIRTIELTHVTPSETVRVLEGVSCSLRNDEIAKDEILARTKSSCYGHVVLGFSNNEEMAKKYTSIYYLEDLESEIEVQREGTSKFYIIINVPELDGYDEKYETVRQNCSSPDNFIYVKLGKK